MHCKLHQYHKLIQTKDQVEPVVLDLVYVTDFIPILFTDLNFLKIISLKFNEQTSQM